MNQEQQTERERELVERAKHNRELMRGLRESQESYDRGEPDIPGSQMREEARARRTRTTPL